MDTQTFFEKLRQNPRPVVVDFWAPWCGPCRAVKPSLEKLAREYAGKVDLWEINADENPELLPQLRIYGIPTLIGFTGEEEKIRHVGAMPHYQLGSLFESLATGTSLTSSGLSGWHRLIRLSAGAFSAWLGWISAYNWPLLVIGGILIFSAVYDRCPIWRAVTTQFKKVMTK